MFVDLNFLNNTGYDSLIDFLYFLVDFSMSIAVLITVVAIVMSGFKYIFSMGDDKKVAEATRSLAYSLVGLILVFLSPTIIEFIIKEIINN